MIDQQYWAQCLSLMHKVHAGELDIPSFVTEFTKASDAARDAQSAVAESWSERHDLALIERFRRGDIAEAQFAKEWMELWQRTPADQKTAEAVDRVYSACDCVGHPDPQVAITESELREVVVAELDELARSV